MAVAWILVVTTLSFFTWNKVVVAQTKFKKIEWWQVLLVVITIASICVPHHRGGRHGKGSCNYEKHHKLEKK